MQHRPLTLPEKTMLKFTFAKILTINGIKGDGNTAKQLWISADSRSCGQSVEILKMKFDQDFRGLYLSQKTSFLFVVVS